MKNWEKKFDKKFQGRMHNIARQLNPSGYAVAEANGSPLDGPQIYGEMKEFFKKVLEKYKNK